MPKLGERGVAIQLFLTQTHARTPSGILSGWFLPVPSFPSKLAFLSHPAPLKEVVLIPVSACYSDSSPLWNVMPLSAWLKSSFPCETLSDYSQAQCSLRKTWVHKSIYWILLRAGHGGGRWDGRGQGKWIKKGTFPTTSTKSWWLPSLSSARTCGMSHTI